MTSEKVMQLVADATKRADENEQAIDMVSSIIEFTWKADGYEAGLPAGQVITIVIHPPIDMLAEKHKRIKLLHPEDYCEQRGDE